VVEQGLDTLLDQVASLRTRALRFAPKDEDLRAGFRQLTHELEQLRQARPVPRAAYHQVSRWLAAFLDAEQGAALASPEHLETHIEALHDAIQEKLAQLNRPAHDAGGLNGDATRELARCLEMLNHPAATVAADALPGALAQALKQHLEGDDALRAELSALTGAMRDMLDEVSTMLAEVTDEPPELKQTAALLQQELPDDPEAARAILQSAQQGILEAGRKLASAAGRIKATVAAQGDKVRELTEQLEAAERQALHDPLTGLPNRRKLEQFLRKLPDAPAAFVMADIDHFKRINDRHGHDAGDEVLAKVGSILAGGVRASDLAARMGGEEFGIVLVGASGRHAFEAADALRRAVAMADIKCRHGKVPVTISMGVAVRRGDEEIPHWLKRADAALYEAKNGGRDQVKVATA